MVDMHCHILPAIDDGAGDAVEALGMVRMALADGIGTMIATPHQLGSFADNDGKRILERVQEFQQLLEAERILLRIEPGGEVRLDPGFEAGDVATRIASGELLTLANRRRHLLVDFREPIYLPLEEVLAELGRAGISLILAHPERNKKLLSKPEMLRPLVAAGCLLQVTAGSLLGEFGDQGQALAEWLIGERLVHFVATDAHRVKFRKPLMAEAFDRVAALAGKTVAQRLCRENPAAILAGEEISAF